MSPSFSLTYQRIFKISLGAFLATILPIHSMEPEQTVTTNLAVPVAPTNAPVELTPPVPAPAVTNAPSSVTNIPVEKAPAIPEPATSGSKSPEPTPNPTPKFTFSSVRVDGPYIAITFDDGPNPVNTPKLLDLLASRHIKATFFVVGENAVRMPDIMKRIIAEGHEIGNHSWDHPNFGKSSDEKVRSEVQRTNDTILAATGIKPTLLRPPYGSMTPRQRQWVHDEFGYDIILWDVDPDDWKEPGVSVVAQRIISGTRPGSIILSHDIHAPTIEAMPEVFDTLLAKGFKFVTVSELIAMDKGPAPPTPTSTPAAALAQSKPSPPPKPKSKPKPVPSPVSVTEPPVTTSTAPPVPPTRSAPILSSHARQGTKS